MRRSVAIFVVVITVISATLASAESMDDKPFWNRNIDKAWVKAQQTRRPVVMIVQMQGCVFCKKMEHETLNDIQNRNELSRRYTPVLIDRAEAPQLINRLNVTIYPTTVLIGMDGRVADSIPGYLSPVELRARMAKWRANPRLAETPRR